MQASKFLVSLGVVVQPTRLLACSLLLSVSVWYDDFIGCAGSSVRLSQEKLVFVMQLQKVVRMSYGDIASEIVM